MSHYKSLVSVPLITLKEIHRRVDEWSTEEPCDERCFLPKGFLLYFFRSVWRVTLENLNGPTLAPLHRPPSLRQHGKGQ